VKLSRRMMLRAGGGALALPLLSNISGRVAHADTPTFPKRLIVLFSPNGTIPSAWAATGAGPSFALGDIMTPLAQHQNDLIVVQNLEMSAALHSPGGDAHGLGMGCMLTATELLAGTQFVAGMGGPGSGWPGGISVDQLIASRVGSATTFPSLEFSIKRMDGSIWSRMSYQGPAIPVTPMDDPSVAFTRIFASVGADPGAVAKNKILKKSVLDAIIGQYATLSPTLSAADKTKIDTHLAALRDLETRVEATVGALPASCTKPAAPMLTATAPVSFNSSGMEVINAAADVDVPQRHQILHDLLVASFACDLTRVASIIMAPSRSDIVPNWIPDPSDTSSMPKGIPDSHHDLSHHGDSDTVAEAKLVAINQWYAGQVAALISALKAVPEGAGTLFDNTVILWCNELGIGNAHTHTNVPFMLAGSAGGYFKTGQSLKFPDGTAQNNLHISLCQAMGLSDVKTFGNPAYCTGPLAGLAAG
jgi:hypothetical protein